MATGMNPPILFDGHKAIPLTQLPDEAWTYIVEASGQGSLAELQKLYQAVPWLYRGIHLRANALAYMPFVIMRGDDEVDTSEDYSNALGWLPNPRRLFYLTEASLCISGAAYLFREKNAFLTKGLRYMAPSTVKPEFSKSGGLTGFKRSIDGKWVDFEVEDFLYLWLLDPFKELGAGTPPAHAALAASGVLKNLDNFAATFFERGAIKATVLGVKGRPSADEREKLRNWWQRFATGIKNAFTTEVINADEITATVVGEGIDQLANIEFTRERREDISTALGIPRSIMFSDEANRATSEQHKQNFYEETVIPQASLLAATWNEQILEPLGYRLEFKPQEMAMFQEDEKERAQSLSFLVSALNTNLELAQLAMGILGFDLNEEQEALLAQALAAKEQRRDAMEDLNPNRAPNTINPAANGGSPNGSQETMRSHLADWRSKAGKYVAQGKRGKAGRFESDLIPPTLNAAIAGALEEAQTEEDVQDVFAGLWMGYP